MHSDQSSGGERIGDAQHSVVSKDETVNSASITASIERVRQALCKVIRGKEDVVETVLIAVLAEGSVLLEDVPGVGKTTLAKSIASLIDLEYHRLQCTPDLLPADILGGSIYQPATGTFEFRPGPVFCNVLVADEVNRASPRTQSALLEAMAESHVTIDGNQYNLKQPFIVIATQNPSGFEGTFPLPESQLDRFLVRTSMDYPNADAETDLLLEQATTEPSDNLTPVMSQDELIKLQRLVRDITVDRKIAKYIVEIANATRFDSRIRVGCSPRGSKMLLRASQARAVLKGRDFVLPDDVQVMAAAVLAHRVSARISSGPSEQTREVIEEIVRDVEVPV